MNKWTMCWIAWAIFLLMMFASGCRTAPVKSNAAICRIRFDYADPGVNDQNARALLSFYCACNPSAEPCHGL